MSLRLFAPLLLAAAAGAAPQAGVVRLTDARVERAAVNPNLIPNPGFEEIAPNGVPQGWVWDRRTTDAALAVDETVAHSGKRSLRLTNGTPFGAHIYGTLWTGAPVRLQAGKRYTLSLYARSEAPGSAWFGGGSGWQFRCSIRPTEGRWQRFSLTFVPGEADALFVPRINTDSPTKGFWVDDVKLEEGGVPTADDPTSDQITIEPADQELVIEGDDDFEDGFAVACPPRATGTGANLSAEITLDRPALSLRRALALQPGAYRLAVSGSATGMDDTPRTLRVRLLDGTREVAATSVGIRFLSESGGLARTAALRRRLPALRSLIEKAKAAGQDTAYPMVTYTVLENFAGYAEEDLRYKGQDGRREVRRGLEQVGDMEKMADRLEGELRKALAGTHRLPAVPRWTGTARPQVVGPSFIAPARYRGFATTPRPIFFNGYGHFNQVRADIEKFPDYGVNIIQVEFGPRSLFPEEGKTTDAIVQETRKLLDRASRAGVAVNLLISPHYMPAWMLEKYPEMRKRREGFLQYCLHHPEGQALLKRFVAAAITPLKDCPALHSICLSNEPVNTEEPCEYAASDWRAWLAKRHGDVATLNGLWGAQYATFGDVPLPNPFGPIANPVRLDFVRWNQEWFAGWHRMLADAVHAAAPDLPVHAKGMSWTFLNDGDVRFGADAELFAGFSEINGNDSSNNYSHGSGEFAESWTLNAMAYDLQRSVKDAPVFNSENHLIPDRDTRPVPAEHVRSVLWQGAIHGQSATTIWVWERTFDPKHDFAGSIMHRPACAEAVGRTNLDLNRLAEEVTALQKAPAQVVILQGLASKVWDGGRASDCAGKLYTALSFTGLKLGWVTERQLEAGKLPEAPLLVVPNVAHLSDAAFAGLKRYRGRVLLVGGDDVLSCSDYDRPRAEKLAADRLAFDYGKTTWRDLWDALLPKLAALGLRPAVGLTGAGGRPEWGVSWLTAQTPAGTVANLCNFRSDPVDVRLDRPGTDLLTGHRVEGSFTMAPLEIRLIAVAQ